MIATLDALAIFEAMSQAPRATKKLWFVVDELDALAAIDGLKDALARLRKFGCRCVWIPIRRAGVQHLWSR